MRVVVDPVSGMDVVNRLTRASSPYLQQHATNPVDWYPWGEEALALARREQKPILLSIGYSACHWCHVMAHESFADPKTAELMNTLYVNIKVDREERPDLDRIYQNAHMLLARRPGGWPLTVILTPEQVPFFAGTYFPLEPRHGLPAFRDVLQRVAAFAAEHPEEIARQNDSLLRTMEQMYDPAGGDLPGHELIDRALGELRRQFDVRYGGFGAAPKFPHPATLQWLTHHVALRKDEDARVILDTTLSGMASGGLLDQVGGGFFRYSTDDRWWIPHFEKMLYDNGPLLALYADADARGVPGASEVVARTVGWLQREMTHASGAFFASLDADSEGEEGRYYVWTADAIKALVDPGVWAVVCAAWGLDGPPNFEDRWHLRVAMNPREIAQGSGVGEEAVRIALERARVRLLEQREQRDRPHRDEKIVTAWNALAISGLLRAAERFQRDDWRDMAEDALRAVRSLLFSEGRLCATYRDGYPLGSTGSIQCTPRAYLDDHALLLAACLDLLRARWSLDMMDWAIELADVLLRDFEDRENGGFFFTAADHETLFVRPKAYADDAMTSGNAIASQALLQLGFLLVEPRYLNAAERALQNAALVMGQAPMAHMGMLLALELYRAPPPLVILRGPDALTRQWRETILGKDDRVWVFALPPEGRGMPSALAGKCGQPTRSDRVVAYVCRGTHCAPPQYELNALMEALWPTT
jgi:uncharacterized protein YyaL (SSP411 family)